MARIVAIAFVTLVLISGQGAHAAAHGQEAPISDTHRAKTFRLVTGNWFDGVRFRTGTRFVRDGYFAEAGDG